ncbi:hypothetical protein P153DRAFT_393210 [Dothidotthia symphoricarpi CBS 119687]|uniref:Uncharacterized protein n=1 Tax=Dothidotthia symphoricarpi CBS 119687 TaxID=1392245 RepID=A0A6A6AN84_9PLEO|nr:uncharacterized protein P153DRAFT_393210 [Dothidotthia symphoricarpi CBS 119687]KAF2133389.1 hypothetical protein P153DRAFT_393210 [Dothidotthia symphoricarpi CBS 119687]
MPTTGSPPPSRPSTPAATPPPATPPPTSTLVTPPRISTLRRRGAELFSRSPFSSHNPFEADDFEFASPVAAGETLRGSPDLFGRRSLKRLSHGVSTESRGVGERSPIGAELAPCAGTSQRGMPAGASPQLSTLRRRGAEILAESSFSSQGLWDAEEDEFEHVESGCVSPNVTIRGSPFRSIRGAVQTESAAPLEFVPGDGLKSRYGMPGRFSTSSGEIDEREMLARFGGMEFSPDKTMRVRHFTSTQNTLVRPVVGKTGKENRSIWDVDEDEFDNWPGQDTMLNNLALKFTLKRDTFKNNDSTAHPIVDAIGEQVKSGILVCGANLTAQEHTDLMDELADRSCGNPHGSDAHDEVMQQFFSSCCKALPASRPARHMHIVDRDAYLNSKDNIVQSAFPRLCDAVATVLHLTNPNCLQDFLNPNVKVFEWRRDGHCLLIRRDGNEVIVGTFLNLATLYRWGFYVRCTISDDGQWTETYAAVTQGTTPVTKDGVRFEQFVAEPGRDDVSPSDPRWALYVGREMAYFLLNRQVWDFRTWFRWKLEWEADGVVSNAKERERDLYRRLNVLEGAEEKRL